ncbi:MAG: DUF393 domain-containing protein [Polyangiaceae bacterium]|nr:DUF393 domain-containing protein [Polyangiaceae bacterium]
MSVSDIARHFTRIDPRSLGLFRVLFGGALIADWLQRWQNRIAFYSNDGLLPNHAHLYQLKNSGRLVWSAMHAFSTPGEAAVGLLVILFFYVCFTIGWKTRAFHVLSLASLVSLSARNTFSEGPGEALAIALCALTLFLPLGTSFSLDAALAKIRLARETKPQHLLSPAALHTEAEAQRGRLPGYSPHSIAAIAVLGLAVLVLLTLAKLQSGASWKDGSALHNALNVYMVASPRGFWLRNSGLLGPLTHVVHASQWLVPILLVVPLVRGIARGGAAVLLLIYGLTYGLLTRYALFGGCFVALAALVIAHDTWDRFATKHVAKRVRTVIFDVDCGICFWLCKTLRRYDTAGHLVFQGNGEFPPSGSEEPGTRPMLLFRDDKTKKIVERPMPEGIDSALVERTVVVVRPDGSFATRGAAVVEIFRALPGFGWLGLALSLPGIAALRDRLYDVVARNRTKLSVEMGLNACGVQSVTKDVPLKDPVAPSTELRFRAQALVREIAVATIAIAIAIQSFQANGVGPKVKTTALEPVTWWTRATSRWDVLVPEPPALESKLVVDVVTKTDRKLDTMTGTEATISFDRPYRLGGQWAIYLERVTKEDNKALSDALRKYLTRRGPRYEPPEQNQMFAGTDAFWITKPALEETPITAERLFRHARGGAVLNPIVAPYVTTPQTTSPIGRRDQREAPRPEPDLQEDEDPKEQPLRFPESPGQELQ